MQENRGHTDLVNAVVFIKKMNYIISGSWDATIRIWAGAARHAAPQSTQRDYFSEALNTPLSITERFTPVQRLELDKLPKTSTFQPKKGDESSNRPSLAPMIRRESSKGLFGFGQAVPAYDRVKQSRVPFLPPI